MDVFPHAGEQRVTVEEIAFVVAEDPCRDLIMPDQVVADNEHVILLAEGDVLVGNGEVISVRLRMDAFPLEAVFGRDGVELRFDDGVAARVLAGDLRSVDRRADDKVTLISIFQRRGGLSCGCEANYEKSRQYCRSHRYEHESSPAVIHFCSDEPAGGPKFRRRPASSSEMVLLILREMG